MGGPLRLAEDIGGLHSCYGRDKITLPEAPGLGIEVDEAAVRRFSEAWRTIDRRTERSAT